MAPGLDARISQIAAEIAADKEMIVHPELFNYTRSQLNHAIEKVWGQPEPDNKNYLFVQKLKDNVTMFAGYKSAWQTTHLRKDVEQSRNADVEQSRNAINARYNVNWMRTEYEHTVRSARAAKNYQKYEQDKDIYPYLRYMPSTAAEPRGEHMRLYGIVKPIDDPFWDTWMPPADWGCRCSVEQVRNPNPESLAKQPPDDITLPPATMRNNPGKSGEIFTDKHPMIKKFIESNSLRKRYDLLKEIQQLSIQPYELNKVMKNLDQLSPKKYFERGFKEVLIEDNPKYNGHTDMNGRIWLRKDLIDNVIEGLKNIKNRIPTTFVQEDALSTLWHEINHNRNKIGGVSLDRGAKDGPQRRAMELANELVSRNTLPDFMKELGGNLQNTELTNIRLSTGYDRMVRNYQTALDVCGCNINKVTSDISTQLFDHNYKYQKEGLDNALRNNSKVKLGKLKAKQIVNECINTNKDEGRFKEWVQEFVTK